MDNKARRKAEWCFKEVLFFQFKARLMQRASFKQDGLASQRKARANVHHSNIKNGML